MRGAGATIAFVVTANIAILFPFKALAGGKVEFAAAVGTEQKSGNSTYMICGNPTANNYGCKFKYMLASDNKQHVSVDSCFSGSTYDAYEFRAWIKPV